MKHTNTKSYDPVCGMDVVVDDSQFSTRHRGLAFHFCSAQCLEHFNENPDYYTGLKNVTDTKPLLKHRRLRIDPSSSTATDAACKQIKGLMGVITAAVADGELQVNYDLRQTSLAQIEASANAAGVNLKGGWYGLRRELWKFMERNELANIAPAGTGACCNRPPPRAH